MSIPESEPDNLFYVIWNKTTNQYWSYLETWSDYTNALQYRTSVDTSLDMKALDGDLRIVGPCREGEEP